MSPNQHPAIATAPNVWLKRPPAELAAHIIEAFHEPLRQELPGMREQLLRLQGQGGDHRRAIEVLAREFTAFAADLFDCITREERELFALLERPASYASHVEDIRSLRSAFEAAHEDQRQSLRLMARITDEYRAPSGAGASVRRLYRSLNDLERFMRLHLHLEDDVLFPRVSELPNTRNERS
jgi:regulator of cell morphogenesis and NO signaling